MPDGAESNPHLIERASKGDRRAVGAIFKRYHQRLFRYCAAIVGDPEDARDALQNTMVSVLVALPGEQRSIELEPWLYRIAHNESIDVVRRRRHTVDLDAQELAADAGPEALVESRERMRGLIADLRELPERQRGALVMRELGGLSFEQIGEAFDTSARVARQTVYEARVSLQDMEEGRTMSCADVRRKISDGDRRLIRRRDVSAHMRQCFGCQEFERAITTRRSELAAIAPLPALGAGAILQSVLGGAGSGGAGAGAGAAGAGAVGKALGGSMIAKTVATAAVVTTIGVAVADRDGMIDVLPGHDSSTPSSTGSVPQAFSRARGEELGQAGSTHEDAQSTGAVVVGQSQRHPPNSNAIDGTSAAQGPAATSPGTSDRGNGATGEGTGQGARALNAHGANPNANPNAAEMSGAGQAAPQASGKAHSTEHGSGASPAAPAPPPHAQAEPPAHGPATQEPRGQSGRDQSGGDPEVSEKPSK